MKNEKENETNEPLAAILVAIKLSQKDIKAGCREAIASARQHNPKVKIILPRLPIPRPRRPIAS